MPASESERPANVTVGDRVVVIDRPPEHVRSCWHATPHLTEVLLDPEWTTPPPPSSPLPPRQNLVITAALGSPIWAPTDSPGPWYLAEFRVAQTTWQTLVAQGDFEPSRP
ncbi:MAG: hypothetical protein R2706_09470 [Acidimicrobiales bacterium]